MLCYRSEMMNEICSLKMEIKIGQAREKEKRRDREKVQRLKIDCATNVCAIENRNYLKPCLVFEAHALCVYDRLVSQTSSFTTLQCFHAGFCFAHVKLKPQVAEMCAEFFH